MCRRDSFITHRAFCDALAEENNKANIERQMPRIMSPSLQGQQIPNLQVASLPINNANLPNPQTGTMDHNNKHPLSLLQELMPIPANKPFNNSNNNNNSMSAAGAAGTLFTRSLSSASSAPSLQLSSDSLNVFQENGHQLQPPPAAASPFMSATALLQKAAQMGATVSHHGGGMNSSVAEKGFVVTSMAPTSFGAGAGAGHSFMNQNHYMQVNGQEDHISGQYLNESTGMNGVDMFNAILDQSKAFSKIIEENNRSNNHGVLHGGSSGAINTNIGGTRGSGDVMTLDFLGIGGAGAGAGNFYATQHQVAEKATRDDIWRNWSTKNAGFESFSATSSIN